MNQLGRDNTSAEPRVKVLLLAAGLGTRLRPLTDTVPKCLIPIAGRPLLDYWFDRFAAAGLTDVLINTHHLRDQVSHYIDAVNRGDRFRVTEAYEPELLGSAGTVHANRSFADDADDCLIVYADNLSNVDLRELMELHRSHEDPFTIMLFRTPRPRECGIVTLDDSGRVIKFTEKPNRPISNLANAGIYAVTADAYREIADLDQKDLGFDVLPRFTGRMRGWVWDRYHTDIGAPESLESAQQAAPRVFNLPARESR